MLYCSGRVSNGFIYVGDWDRHDRFAIPSRTTILF